MSIKIVFPDYPVKVQMSKGRRRKYYMDNEDRPIKYRSARYEYKGQKLYDTTDKVFLVRNERSLDKPRFLPLSYNKISTRMKVPVLIKLKEYMRQHIPDDLKIITPCMVDCTVYDFPVPLIKDLDNMHIYYKAFLDLIKDMGFIPDDSKQYVTQAGGFRFTPIMYQAERKLVFSIKEDMRFNIKEHLMYRLYPKKLIRGLNTTGALIIEGKHNSARVDIEPGSFMFQRRLGDTLICNFGKTKIISSNANKIFRALFDWCVNNNTSYKVEEGFYRIHADRIQKFLLNKGVPVTLITN